MTEKFALNVVGGLIQPSNVSENTLWISTNVSISNWDFGVDFPKWPREGEIFIKTRKVTDNTVKLTQTMNVIGSIGTVYQLRRNKWVQCDGAFYQNGIWTSIRYYLYNYGTYHSGYTWVEGGNGVNTFSETDTYYQLAQGGTGGGAGRHVEYHPEAIELTNVDKVIFELEMPAVSAYARYGVSVSQTTDSYANAYTNAAVRQQWQGGSVFDKTFIELDVSELSGLYYINTFSYINADSPGGGTLRVYSIELV